MFLHAIGTEILLTQRCIADRFGSLGVSFLLFEDTTGIED